MTITTGPVIKDRCLTVNGKPVLTRVPSNVVVTPAGSRSAFLGAIALQSSDRHVLTLGTLENTQFMCLFIAKIWWMIPRVGKSGCKIPMETQMLLLEVEEESALDLAGVDEDDVEDVNKFYVLVLPVLDGAFRTTLQGTQSNKLQFCYESGDPDVRTTKAMEGVFVSAGENPFELLKDSIKILAKHKGTFNHLESKKIPAHLDWFGWCTWDAFYTEVTPSGIEQGLQSFKDGGISPRFLIIDDGWQETENEFCKEGEETIEGMQFATRLTDIKENNKFKALGPDGSATSLKELVHHIKENYGLKYVYMSHALAGYWGGVQPSSGPLKKYNPRIEYPVQSPGLIGNIRDIAMDSLEKYGIGVVDPERVRDFYDDMHGYLARSGVDGVKVDVQNVLGTLGRGHGGRVSITNKYHEALDESINKNFRENNLIACMCHNSDSMFSSKNSATARASEDFMPNDPTFQTLHIASVSYNSLLLGEVFVPDWDMFHSDHNTAKFHGAARAIGGCPVYVSDKPGKHDFKILRRLVLPDGSILRARHAGRPTRDCLFIDPVMDGKSLLKIWNLNKLTGVVGVFNCQGAGTWPMKQPTETISNSTQAATVITGRVKPLDVEFLEDIVGETWTEECAVYAFNSGSLTRVAKNKAIEVSLGVLECEVLTISPIKVLKACSYSTISSLDHAVSSVANSNVMKQAFNEHVEFAPIGLINMYNSGGAVEGCKLGRDLIRIQARGCGIFGAYSSTKPRCSTGPQGVYLNKSSRHVTTVFMLGRNAASYCKHSVAVAAIFSAALRG